MQTRSVPALILLALATLASPAASSPPAAPLATATDRAGDVHVVRKAKGLPRPARLSIDLRRVQLSSRPGAVRLTVRLRSILADDTVDQMVFVRLVPVAGSTAGRAEIGLSPQQPRLSYAAHDTDGTGAAWESCDPLRAKVSRRAAEVRLDVPLRCIPSGDLTVEVESLTGYFRSDAARPWSRDRLVFPHPVQLVAS